jgi:hypothetical protein
MDGNQHTHADRHYPLIKTFYYVNDVDLDHGPFCFARGSQHVTAERLKFEYEWSRRWTSLGADPFKYERTAEQHHQDLELERMCEDYLRSIGSHCEPITGKANTLILANTGTGFHKRGAFTGPEPRVTVQLDFKYLESPAQWMFPVLKHLYANP